MTEYICSLCPRSCHAVRTETSGQGFCRMGTLPKVARIAPHFWEEPCISGTKGSGTIFFSGCTLACVFCQNYVISQEHHGTVMTVSELIQAMQTLVQQGVHNINLVSPTPYLESILECFSVYRPPVPVVYNTGGYEKTDSLRRLDGLVDIYLPDLKYIRSDVSEKYSRAKDYAAYALPAIHEMVRQTGKPVFDENGLLQKGTVVRHLILPQNTKNSIAVLETLQSELGDDILLSLMGQYLPMGKAADYPEINRRITKREYEKVLAVYENLGLDGYIQELSSADSAYVPDFGERITAAKEKVTIADESP